MRGDDVKGKICDPAEGSKSLSPSCWLFFTDVRLAIYLHTCLCPFSLFPLLSLLSVLFIHTRFFFHSLFRLNLSRSFNISPTLRLAGTSNTVVVAARQAGNRFQGILKCLQIRAQLFPSASARCKAGPCSNLGSATQSRPSIGTQWRALLPVALWPFT